MMKKISIILTLFAIGTGIYSCGGGGGGGGNPMPQTFRNGVYFGYYGQYGTSLDETNKHVNLSWESQFDGFDPMINRMVTYRLPTILDISYQLYDLSVTPRVVRPDGEQRVRDLFNQIRNKGVLGLVVGVYPIDEPNTNVVSENEIRKGNAIARKVMGEFYDLSGAVLVSIYSGVSSLTAIDDYDWVGFDDYSIGSKALTIDYPVLMRLLSPTQKTIIVPGGAYGELPDSWVSFANTHAEVIAIIPFIWLDNWDQKGAKGIKSNGQAINYCKAGTLVAKKAQTC